MPDYISMTIPATEMIKFRHWVTDQGKEKSDEAKKIFIKTIFNIEKKSKELAPVNHGFLRSSIHPEFTSDNMAGSVYTRRKYAAYQEWGTGTGVNVPSFVKTMFGVDSMEWKGRGKRKVNMKAHPYLFAVARVEYIRMMNELKALGFK